jgi:hypothetical protein
VLPLTGSDRWVRRQPWKFGPMKACLPSKSTVDVAINVPASVGQQTHSNNLKTLQIADGAYVKLMPLTNQQVFGVNHS